MANGKGIAAIVMLVVGVALIPTGFITNSYLQDQVTNGIPQVLSTIRNETVPEIEQMVKEDQTPGALVQIRSEAIPEIEDMAKAQQAPGALVELKGETIDYLEYVTNSTITANTINQTLSGLLSNLGWDFYTVYGGYFNDSNFQADFGGFPTIKIQGITEINGSYLNYSYPAEVFTMNGSAALGIPGWGTDLNLGSGVIGFLDLYDNATNDMTDNLTMQMLYNANWTQLKALHDYLYYYMFLQIVPVVAASEYGGMTTKQIAESSYYTQWSNATLVPTGLAQYDDRLTNWEAGIPVPVNLSYSQCKALWDPLNSSAFVNDTGIMVWLGAAGGDPTAMATLKSLFQLDDTQLGILISWLVNWMSTTFLTLAEQQLGMSLDNYSVILFYQQWANGTVIPGGFGSVDPTLTGFEIGLPTATGWILPQVEDLWAEANASTFVNKTGFDLWLNAIDNQSSDDALSLKSKFGLSTSDLNKTVVWLQSFMDNVFPGLLENEVGMNISAYSLILFYQQWANGTVVPEGLKTQEPVLDGFEVGLPDPTNILLTQCQDLWNETNPSSLLNVTGYKMWFAAAKDPSSSTATDLQTTFGLSDAQMTSLLSWVNSFRTTVAPAAVSDIATANSLGPILQWSLLGGGLVLIVIGVVTLVFARRK